MQVPRVQGEQLRAALSQLHHDVVQRRPQVRPLHLKVLEERLRGLAQRLLLLQHAAARSRARQPPRSSARRASTGGLAAAQPRALSLVCVALAVAILAVGGS